MKFAILAAGNGSRLREEGVKEDKPLVSIGNERLLGRLTRIFVQEGAEEIEIIAQPAMTDVVAYVHQLQRIVPVPLRLIEQQTASSMHSFFALSPFLQDAPFCLTTVDTIFKESEFHAYLTSFCPKQQDAWMAVTSYVDDEKPLWIDCDESRRIQGFHDSNAHYPFVSGGIYCMTPSVLPLLADCVERGVSRMRNFQRELLKQGLDVFAYPFSEILDIDHKEDIAKAELFLKAN